MAEINADDIFYATSASDAEGWTVEQPTMRLRMNYSGGRRGVIEQLWNISDVKDHIVGSVREEWRPIETINEETKS